MSVNFESSKQALEVVFYRKNKKPDHQVLIFSNKQVIQTPYQKYLGMLGHKLNFKEHLKYIT